MRRSVTFDDAPPFAKWIISLPARSSAPTAYSCVSVGLIPPGAAATRCTYPRRPSGETFSTSAFHDLRITGSYVARSRCPLLMPHAIAYVKNALPLVSGELNSSRSSKLGDHSPSSRWTFTTDFVIVRSISMYFGRDGWSFGKYWSTRTRPPITQLLPRLQKIFLPFFVVFGGKKFLSR